MAEIVAHSLNEQLLPLLRTERFVLLNTVDKETGAPNMSAISWIHAPSESCIFFAVDNRSRIVENIKNNVLVTLTLIGAGSVYAIAGHATIVDENMTGVPLKLAKVRMDIREVRDVMFYGSRISVEPQYEKTYDKKAAEKLDSQVMTALKNN
ncbi:pyridoxamine 5'-phosphate oxidase family protein [Ammoniphilus sp. YIM 78166]|uniref:pyridoxamine 5'-phosphate oxidase family protein n=1 Tax=Ammoniphilus sp. YIM 78166 TaxID=1644106 RepID=UPI00106FF041|nr:pyridoxamine 5'-phosphate oxidase family protein [Ammoniphilus sp. YIM 78166]